MSCHGGDYDFICFQDWKGRVVGQLWITILVVWWVIGTGKQTQLPWSSFVPFCSPSPYLLCCLLSYAQNGLGKRINDQLHPVSIRTEHVRIETIQPSDPNHSWIIQIAPFTQDTIQWVRQSTQGPSWSGDDGGGSWNQQGSCNSTIRFKRRIVVWSPYSQVQCNCQRGFGWYYLPCLLLQTDDQDLHIHTN